VAAGNADFQTDAALFRVARLHIADLERLWRAAR